MRRSVTVVVPLYSHPDSIAECISSLNEHVDPRVDQVLLINDCGPEADEIEHLVLSLIEGRDTYRYERNPRNLGFVATCNRAVNELDGTENDVLILNSDTVVERGFVDELSDVLYVSDLHGAVCPRSNNATIATIPYRLAHSTTHHSVSRSREIHGALRDSLPRYNVAPVAMGFCLLIRRELIARFGLFDEVFSPGYGEENDFCLRINQHGFLSVIANRAFVQHIGSQSFGTLRAARLRASHARILRARYPYFHRAVSAFVQRDRDGVDRFADLLVAPQNRPSILIDIASERGALSAQVLDLLAAANTLPEASGHEVVVRCAGRTSRRLRQRYSGLKFGSTSLEKIHDLAVVFADEASPSQLARLNISALRWLIVFTSPYPSADWSRRVRSPHVRSTLVDCARYADISIHVPPSSAHELAALLGADEPAPGTVQTGPTTGAHSVIQSACHHSRDPVDLHQLRERSRHFALTGPSLPDPRLSSREWWIHQIDTLAPSVGVAARKVLRRSPLRD